jgi:hypothetical protein
LTAIQDDIERVREWSIKQERTERDAAREKNANLIDLLRRVEWTSRPRAFAHGFDCYCLVCGAAKTIGHCDDCELAAALKGGSER